MNAVALQRLRYIASDFVLLNIGWLAFNMVRFRSLPLDWAGSFAEFFCTPPVILGQIFVPLLAVAMFALSGYYNYPYFKSRVDDVLNTAGVSAVAAVAVFFAVLVNDKIPERLLNYQLLFILWTLMAAPVYLGRHWLTARSKRMIGTGKLSFGAIMIGSGTEAHALAARMARTPAARGLQVLAFVDTAAETTAGNGAISLDQAMDMVRDGLVHTVIIAEGHDNPSKMAEFIGRLIPLQCTVLIKPDLYNILTVRPRVRSVANEPLVNITSAGMSAATYNFKRLGDIVVSTFALLALIPVFAAVAIAVKTDSAGPVFYSQERIGYRKRKFRIYKFRTMRPDAEANGPQLSRDGDPRITRTGAILRKYRLDELPQFWNVLRGDMSSWARVQSASISSGRSNSGHRR